MHVVTFENNLNEILCIIILYKVLLLTEAVTSKCISNKTRCYFNKTNIITNIINESIANVILYSIT